MSKIWTVLVGLCLAGVTGCAESKVTNVCGEGPSDISGVPLLADGGTEEVSPPPDAGQGGQGGASPLLGDGAPCSANDECENAACIPASNSFGSGYCWGPMMNGCIVVGDGSPFHAQCDGALQRLYTCGDYDVSLLGQCAELGTGEFGEVYHCCSLL